MENQEGRKTEKLFKKSLKDKIIEGVKSTSLKMKKRALVILTVAGAIWGISEYVGDTVNDVSDTNNKDAWSLVVGAVEASGKKVENIQDADYITPNIIRIELDKEYDELSATKERGHNGLYYIRQGAKNAAIRAYRFAAQVVGDDDRYFYNIETGNLSDTQVEAEGISTKKTPKKTLKKIKANDTSNGGDTLN